MRKLGQYPIKGILIYPSGTIAYRAKPLIRPSGITRNRCLRANLRKHGKALYNIGLYMCPIKFQMLERYENH